MEDNRFMSRLHPFVTARKSIMNHHHLVVVPSSAEEMLMARPASAGLSTSPTPSSSKIAPTGETKAKARDQQKKWRENLKKDTAKSAEYREMQRERTRMWKEKMRINDAERFEAISRRHQAQCKKWWDKLTPEQRREKRKQYNLKWRQNQKKGLLGGDASDSSDSNKEGDVSANNANNWLVQQQQSSTPAYGGGQQLIKAPAASGSNPSGPEQVATPPYYSKSNGTAIAPVFNVVSGSVVYPFSYFPFRCPVQQQQSGGRGASS